MDINSAMSYSAQSALAQEYVTDEGNTIDEKIDIFFKRFTQEEIKSLFLQLITVTKSYNVDRFTITLKESTVTRFEDLVCPISTKLLHGYTKFYIDNKYVTDEVMSALIEGSMLREIHQYDTVN